MTDEKRYVLGVAYQAGPDPDIKTGADGFRDYFPADELEKAAWQFFKNSRQSGLLHGDGPEALGHSEVVESYIYRGPDWYEGGELFAKSGDWLIGSVLDEPTWAAAKRGELGGFSPQGVAKRRRPTRSSA
jgi:hypothetical protein